MRVTPSAVGELRAMFKTGATPSALVRRIAEWHRGEPRPDVLVRDYFREAFHVPTVRIGPDQVAAIAAGGSLPALNTGVLHQMIRARSAWDDTPHAESWLNSTTRLTAPAVDPRTIPELADSWDRLDDRAREFLHRLFHAAAVADDKVNALAALAERLQQQTTCGVRAAVPSAA